MTKMHVVLASITYLLVGLLMNLLSDLGYPLIDPGDKTALRIYMMVSILLLFALFQWIDHKLRQSKPPEEVDPEETPTTGWFEAFSLVPLAFSVALAICWELASEEGLSLLYWAVPAIIGLVTLATPWPSERLARYRTLSEWVYDQLLRFGTITFDQVLNHFVPGVPMHDAKERPEIVEYKVLITWFLRKNQDKVEKTDNGIFLKPHTRPENVSGHF